MRHRSLGPSECRLIRLCSSTISDFGRALRIFCSSVRMVRRILIFPFFDLGIGTFPQIRIPFRKDSA